MNFKYKIIDRVNSFIKDAELEEISIGCSNSQVFKIIKKSQIYFLKIANKGLLTSEYEKLCWLKGRLKVPQVILYEVSDNTEYLITEAVLGEMVCSKKYIKDPIKGIKIIVQAFKHIYSVDIRECPFDVSIDYKLNIVEKNVNNNLIKEEDIKEEVLKKYGNINNVLNYLKENKFYDEPCFSHGDTSLPNVFAKDDEFTSFIDVGECGIADKWFDLAICEKSIKRNYGEKYIDVFYSELGINPDRKKIDYYLLMMQLYL